MKHIGLKALMRVFVIGLILFGAFVAAPAAQTFADKANLTPVVLDKKTPNILRITLGKGEVVPMDGNVADVLVANPAIAEVSAIQANRLYIVGLNLGDTNLVILDSEGEVLQRMDIHVKLDEKAIQNYLDNMYPDEDIRLSTINDQIVLAGSVSSPVIANQVSQIVAAYVGEVQGTSGAVDSLIVNLLNVRGEQQVMLKVKVFEASKTLLRELGLETTVDDVGTSFGGGEFSGSFLNVASQTGLSQNPFAAGGLIFQNSNFGPMQILLNMLEEDSKVHTLAEPNLTAISGQEAGFLAGGEFPVPTGRDSEGNVVIEFRPFGVSLNFRPVVLSESRISLQLQTEVSSLSRDTSVTLQGLEVPGLNIRRASTTIEVPSGGGMMIAGLLQSQAVKGMAGLPGIRDVPVLGDLVSSRSFNRDESELIVVVTAYIVKPYAEQHVSAVRGRDIRPVQPASGGLHGISPSAGDAGIQPLKLQEVEEVRATPVIQNDRTAGGPVKVTHIPDREMPQKISSAGGNTNANPSPVQSIQKTDRSVADGNVLRDSFAENIRRIYGRKAPQNLNEPGQFGYLMQ